MKQAILLAMLAVSVCGCNTFRSGLDVGKSVINAGVAVKDDVFAAAETLINAAESIKTNALAGVKSTADAATK